MNKIKSLSWTQIVSYLLVVFSVCALALSVYMTLSVDVIEDWELELPDQKIHINDEITISSVYVKKMNVKGTAFRYLDCKNKDGVSIRYELNQRVADRAARAGGTGIVVKMPDTVVDLPAPCRVAVAIDYEIFGPKHVIETNETEEFTLYPEETASAEPADDGSQGTNQTPVAASSPVNSYSSSQNTPSEKSLQSNISQPDQQNEENPGQAGIIQNLLNTIDGTLNNLIGER